MNSSHTPDTSAALSSDSPAPAAAPKTDSAPEIGKPSGDNPTVGHTYSVNIEDKDLYRVAVDTRNLEINLFWQRSNYFLVLNTALAIGYFNTKNTDPILSACMAIFGAIVSMLWFKVTIGSKYWQSRWEHRLFLVEEMIAKNALLFSAAEIDVQNDVENSLKWRAKKEGRLNKLIDLFSLKTYIEGLVSKHLRSHSVSYNMTLLSLLFVLGWLCLALLASCRLSWIYCQ